MRIFAVLILTAFCQTLATAFTITAPNDTYTVDRGQNVSMRCTFTVNEKMNMTTLVASWQKNETDIIDYRNGTVSNGTTSRISLPKDQLLNGSSVLQITDVKLQDGGQYTCLLSVGDGADYKRITLKVNAPYRKINQRISVDPATSEHELMCQAEGYPLANVTWTTSKNETLDWNTTVTTSQTEEKLLNVTSILRVNATVHDVFNCTFWGVDSNHTAELIIPELPVPRLPHNRTHWVLLGSVLLFLIVAFTVFFYVKKN